jgi:hypothetical protein
MNIETLNNRQLGEIEQTGDKFLQALKRGKLSDNELYQQIHKLVDEVGRERRRRFDQVDPGHLGTANG